MNYGDFKPERQPKVTVPQGDKVKLTVYKSIDGRILLNFQYNLFIKYKKRNLYIKSLIIF